jgi:SAM-dependent methyltransferase
VCPSETPQTLPPTQSSDPTPICPSLHTPCFFVPTAAFAEGTRGPHVGDGNEQRWRITDEELLQLRNHIDRKRWSDVDSTWLRFRRRSTGAGPPPEWKKEFDVIRSGGAALFLLPTHWRCLRTCLQAVSFELALVGRVSRPLLILPVVQCLVGSADEPSDLLAALDRNTCTLFVHHALPQIVHALNDTIGGGQGGLPLLRLVLGEAIRTLTSGSCGRLDGSVALSDAVRTTGISAAAYVECLSSFDILDHLAPSWLARTPMRVRGVRCTGDTFPSADLQMALGVIAVIGRSLTRGTAVLEMGMGSGVLLLALADYARRSLRQVTLVGADTVPDAVDDARWNLEGYDDVTVVESDLFSAIGGERRFDVIFWNPPWFDSDDPDDWDSATNTRVPVVPSKTLVDRGYETIRRFLAEAPYYLRPGGRVILIFPKIHLHRLMLRTGVSFFPLHEYRTPSFDVAFYQAMVRR